MKTVGDFKKAGLVFVGEDVISAHIDNHGRMEKITNSYADDVNGDLGLYWGASLVGGFAWRDNKGAKPEFDGLVDWERADGALLETDMESLIWNDNVERWRPHLAASMPTETPEEKEALDRIDAASKDYSAKHDQDKPMYNLLPANAIDALARVLTFGAKKYGANAWQNLEDGLERYRAALLRHTFAIQRGELIDEDSGEPHSALAMCCAAFINELEGK